MELHFDVMEHILNTRDPTPKGLLELTVRKCNKSTCKQNHIGCFSANEMPRTDSCPCMGEDQCENRYKATRASDSESDSEDQRQYVQFPFNCACAKYR